MPAGGDDIYGRSWVAFYVPHVLRLTGSSQETLMKHNPCDHG
jgi:hypothetical protein